ncbi:MAG: hypothetical protein U0744_20790 [Gemmataceae bacterium]
MNSKTPHRIPATPNTVPPAGWLFVRDAVSGQEFCADPGSLKVSPPQSALTPEQEERIRHVADALQEHDASPYEQWLENMRRDALPEAEIRVWEDVARAYEAEVQERPSSTFEERHSVYGALVYASLLPENACRVGNVLSTYPQAKGLRDLDRVIDRFRTLRFGK